MPHPTEPQDRRARSAEVALPEALARIHHLEARVRELEAERERLRIRVAQPSGDDGFRELADAAPAILWVTDDWNRCTFLSRGWYDYTGQAEGEGLGTGWLDVVHPDDRERAGRIFMEAAQNRQPFSFDYRLRRHDGEFRWAADQGRPRFRADGTLAGFVGSVIEIHDREVAAAALALSEEKYRTLFASIDEGFCILEVIFAGERAVDLRYLEVNPAFQKQTGLHGAVGRTIRELVPSIEPHWIERYGEVARTGVPVRFASHAAPMERWYDVYAFRVGEPGEHLVAVLFDDITQAKAAEGALATERAKLATVIENLPVGVGLGDTQGRFLSLNRAALGIHGFRSEAEMLEWLDDYDGRFELSRLNGDPLPIEEWPASRAVRGEFVRDFEVWLRNVRTAEERIVSYDVVPIRNSDGAVTFVVYLIQDLTERKEAERAIEDARAAAEGANRVKADFLAAMSHELRTPLNAIGGYVELLELGIHGSLSEAQHAALARVTANQRHLLSLINDILSFARLEAGRMEFDLQDLPAAEMLASMEALVTPQAEAKGIAYTVEHCDGALHFRGDAERVRQILLNLVANAIKFTPAGGWVVLSCDSGGGVLSLRVRDNGIGIPKDEQERIFDPFQQVGRRFSQPQDGVGLGLAISRDLARAMGGELVVESAPGEGSTFSLHLPLPPSR